MTSNQTRPTSNVKHIIMNIRLRKVYKHIKRTGMAWYLREWDCLFRELINRDDRVLL